MARYVDIDKMHEFNCPRVWKYGENCPDGGCAECFYNNGDVEDVAPIVHAEWITDNFSSRIYPHMCSNCNATCDWQYNYCPDCGAKMDKE